MTAENLVTLESAQSVVDVSAVIVNWNTRELLLDCVASLLEETQQSSLEIIVVDNASSDGSMTALAERFRQVQQIRNSENVGFSRANNQGLRIARGRYLCLVNSDVKALDGVLDKLRAFMDAHEDVGAVAPVTVGGNLKPRRNCREYPTLRSVFCQSLFLNKMSPSSRMFRGDAAYRYDYATTQDIEVLSGCFLMVRREVIEHVGMLDERFFIYSEDVDWCKRIHDGGWRVVSYPRAQAIHYGGSSSSVERTRFSVEMMRANFQYWRKHHGPLPTLSFWVIQVLGALIRAMGWSASVPLLRRNIRRRRAEAVRYWRLLWWLTTTGISYALADPATTHKSLPPQVTGLKRANT